MTTVVEIPMFDLDDFTEEPPAGSWPFRVPPRFSLEYFPTDELLAAHAFAVEAWRVLPYGHPDYDRANNLRARMWKQDVVTPRLTGANGHSFVLLEVGGGDDWCTSEWWGHNPDCHSVRFGGDLGLSMVQCDDCQWRSVQTSEDAAVAAWHDHAWPGWRDLPIVPLDIERQSRNMRISKHLVAWVREHYPAWWAETPGAPIITERQPRGTRSVAGNSPTGGYDLSYTILEAVVR